MDVQRTHSFSALFAAATIIAVTLAGCVQAADEPATQSSPSSDAAAPSSSPVPTVPPELAGLEEGWERGLPQPGSAGFVSSARNSVGGDTGTASTWDDQVLEPGSYRVSFVCAADSDSPPVLGLELVSGESTLIDELLTCDRGIVEFPVVTTEKGAVTTVTSADGDVAAWAYAIVKG